MADWYRASILSSLWGFAPERFTSQAFWDCFDAIATGESLPAGQRDELEEAQLRLLGLWKEKQLVTRRLLAYDTTNFYTYIASNNERNSLAQRGHNKQGRHNLRQVGLSLCPGWGQRPQPLSSSLSRQRGRHGEISLKALQAHRNLARAQPDRC